MPIQPPSRQQLEWIADAFHMTLTDEELDVFTEVGRARARGLSRLDELPDEQLPVKYARADLGHRPVGEENPGNGVGLEVLDPGRRRMDRSRGGRVGVKDNVCLAGDPDCSTARRSWRASSRARTRPWSRGCWTRARTSSARPPCRRSASTAAA